MVGPAVLVHPTSQHNSPQDCLQPERLGTCWLVLRCTAEAVLHGTTPRILWTNCTTHCHPTECQDPEAANGVGMRNSANQSCLGFQARKLCRCRRPARLLSENSSRSTGSLLELTRIVDAASQASSFPLKKWLLSDLAARQLSLLLSRRY